MKKIALVGILACSVFMVGCGEDKTPDQIKYDQEKEILAMKMAHEREMARINVKGVQAQNQVSHTYVENEYNQQDNYQQNSGYERTSSYASQQGEQYSSGGYTNQAAAPQSYDVGTSQAQAQQSDEGFGVGSMALAALGGAAAGYFAGEMLNNGMKSYKDERGNTHYTDRDGRPVSKAAYEDHKKKNPKTTAFKEKASDLKAKTSAGAQNFREQARGDKEKIQQNQKYQQSKTYTQDTSNAIKGKMESRIPPKPNATPSRPVVKPQAKPVSKPTSRPSSKPRR
ncbi:MAG: hypothetical protein ACRC9Y_07250 [Aeromonas veronii]